MQINYNVTGARRKEMVKVISDTIGVKAEYKYMPTCNYEIGDFTVTKNGFLEFNDSVDSAKVKKVLEAIAAAGFSFKQQEKTNPEESEKTPNEAIIATKDEQDGETGLTIVLPLEDVEVENLNHILMAKETLILPMVFHSKQRKAYFSFSTAFSFELARLISFENFPRCAINFVYALALSGSAPV